MGIQKNATYKVHNGTDFDEINFKTILDQVKFPDGTSLLDFFNNGGKISGDLELPPGKKIKSKMSDGRNVNIAYMQNNGAVTYGDGLNPTFLAGAERPSVWENNAANPIVCLKDFINLKGSTGYRQTADGFIEQWGVVTITGQVANAWCTNWSIQYPKLFPNAVVSLDIQILADGNSHDADLRVMPYLTDNTNTFQYHCKVGSNGTLKFKWRALGY